MAFLDSVPFLDGKYLTYRGYFTLLSFLVSIILSLLFFLISYKVSRVFSLDSKRRRLMLKKMEKKVAFADRDVQLRRAFEMARFDVSSDEIRRRAASAFVKSAPQALDKLDRVVGSEDQKEDDTKVAFKPQSYFEFPEIPDPSKFQLCFTIFLTYLHVVLDVLGYVFLCFGITTIGAFGYISIYFTQTLCFLIFLFKFIRIESYLSSCYYYDPLVTQKYKLTGFRNKATRFFLRIFRKVQTGVKENIICSIVTLLLFLLYPIFLAVFFKGTCVCNFFGAYGISLESMGANSAITTNLLRSWNINQVCPEGPPTHVYATLPEAVSTDVFINFHVNENVKEAQVFYELHGIYTESGTMSKSKEATLGSSISGLDKLGRRSVFCALLSDLEPDSLYDILISFEGKNQSQHAYKTLPNAPSDEYPLVFVFGGDIGNYEMAWNITKRVASVVPDLIVFGYFLPIYPFHFLSGLGMEARALLRSSGDLSYDNGMNSCYHSWDLFFQQYKIITDEAGVLVPFFSSLGNHDIGLNDYSETEVSMDENAPLFFHFIPQNFARKEDGSIDRSRVPSLSERMSYFSHQIGNICFLNLDTGYVVAERDSSMLDWMKATMLEAKENGSMVMVSYHKPIYPICGHNDKDKTHNVESLTYWVPIFDYFKVISVFENHQHYFKRTYPLKGSQVSEKGTVYFGDGLWGVEHKSCKMEKRNLPFELFAKNSSSNHFWKTSVYASQVKLEAIDQNGEVLDQVTQYFDDYLGFG